MKFVMLTQQLPKRKMFIRADLVMSAVEVNGGGTALTLGALDGKTQVIHVKEGIQVVLDRLGPRPIGPKSREVAD